MSIEEPCVVRRSSLADSVTYATSSSQEQQQQHHQQQQQQQQQQHTQSFHQPAERHARFSTTHDLLLHQHSIDSEASSRLRKVGLRKRSVFGDFEGVSKGGGGGLGLGGGGLGGIGGGIGGGRTSTGWNSLYSGGQVRGRRGAYRGQSGFFSHGASTSGFGAFNMHLLTTALKNLEPHQDDDIIDRLNYFYTPSVLIICALLVSMKQYMGHPIECWVPAQFTKSMEQYTENYCWIQNTYFIPFDEYVPWGTEQRFMRQIGYYQWTPFLLAIQAAFFYFPCMIWRWLNSQSGLNIREILDMACDERNIEPENRSKTIDILSRHIDDSLKARKPRTLRKEPFLFTGRELYPSPGSNQSSFYPHSTSDPFMSSSTSYPATPTSPISRISGLRDSLYASSLTFLFPQKKRQVVSNKIRCNPTSCGRFVCILYVIVKFIYLINAAGQFLFLNHYLEANENGRMFGLNVFVNVISGIDWHSTGKFPRVTLCDLDIRVLGNVHKHTVQCVLVCNMFTEKIFAVCWIWFVALVILNSFSVVHTLVSLGASYAQVSFVVEHLTPSLRNEKRLNQSRPGAAGLAPIRDSSESGESDGENHNGGCPNDPGHVSIQKTTIFAKTIVNLRHRSKGPKSIETKSIPVSKKQERPAITRNSAGRFIESFLKADGVFLLRLISGHAGTVMCNEVLFALWHRYLQRRNIGSNMRLGYGFYDNGSSGLQQSPSDSVPARTPNDDKAWGSQGPGQANWYASMPLKSNSECVGKDWERNEPARTGAINFNIQRGNIDKICNGNNSACEMSGVENNTDTTIVRNDTDSLDSRSSSSSRNSNDNYNKSDNKNSNINETQKNGGLLMIMPVNAEKIPLIKVDETDPNVKADDIDFSNGKATAVRCLSDAAQSFENVRDHSKSDLPVYPLTNTSSSLSLSSLFSERSTGSVNSSEPRHRAGEYVPRLEYRPHVEYSETFSSSNASDGSTEQHSYDNCNLTPEPTKVSNGALAADKYPGPGASPTLFRPVIFSNDSKPTTHHPNSNCIFGDPDASNNVARSFAAYKSASTTAPVTNGLVPHLKRESVKPSFPIVSPTSEYEYTIRPLSAIVTGPALPEPV